MMMTYIYDIYIYMIDTYIYIYIYIYICYGKGNKIGNYAYFPAVIVQLGNLMKNEIFMKFSGYFA